MKNILLFIICFLSFTTDAQTWEWAFQTKGLTDIKSGIADDNSVYLTGNFQDSCIVNGTIFTGSGTISSVLLIKLSSSGNIIWSRNFSATGIMVRALQMHHNDVFISGNFVGFLTGAITDTSSAFNNFFVAGFSPSGNVIFYKREGAGVPHWWGLRMEDMFISNDHILVTGRYYDSTEISGQLLPLTSYPSIYLVKYNLSGTMTLLKTITSSCDTYNCNNVYQVRTDQTGNIYLHVLLRDTVNITSDTTLIFNYTYNYTTQLLLLDTAGKFKKIKIIGGYGTIPANFTAQGDFGYTINLMSIESAHLCSKTRIYRNENSDSIPWTYSYGGSHIYSSPPYLAMSPGDLSATDNFVYFTGNYGGPLKMGNDSLLNHGMFLAKIDHNGNYQYAKSYEYNISPKNSSNVANGSLIVTGEYSGAAYLGSCFLDDTVSSILGFVARFNDSPMTGMPGTKKENSDIILFPNPTSGHFTLQLNEGIQKQIQYQDMIFVFDQSGKCILRQQFSNSTTQQIDISKMAKGIYFVEVETDKERINKKIVLN